MSIQIQRRRILIAALAGAAFAALGITIASGRAAPEEIRDLPKSSGAGSAVFAALDAGTTYQASLLTASPSLTPPVRGWLGTQWVSRQAGRVRYQTAALDWRDFSFRDIEILSGPAMTLSPAATLARPRSRIPYWNFSPYEPPGPVKRWKIAGRTALYFDATAPPPGAWTLVGSNPPELQIEHDHSFRMAALTVRGKTVVIVIEAPQPRFAEFLPIAKRLVASLRFPPS